MDGPSWTPSFQPPSDDDPINMMQTFNNAFDQAFDQTYGWAQAQQAHLASLSRGSTFPSANWPQYLTGQDSQVLHMGGSNSSFQHELSSNLLSEPYDNFAIDGTVSAEQQESHAFYVPPEPLAPLWVAKTDVAEKSPDVLSEEYLSTLTPKQLEEFRKKATELLEKSHKKSQEAAATPPLHQHQRSTRRSNPSGRAQKGSITCEHPGCTTTFSRKKDQKRHFKVKHGNPQSFRCPIIDCWMGEGHEFSRSDKLRDHLYTKSLASATWRCIIPDCSQTRVGKEGILHHLKTHEQAERQRELVMLHNYGFVNFYYKPEQAYLELKNICTIFGCPFGTNSDDVMKSHLSTPHEGPLCPCPITSCEQYFRERNEVSGHLSRDHDALYREYFKNNLTDQGFSWEWAVFICPICKFEIRKVTRPGLYEENKFRKHFRTHNLEERVKNFQVLVQAFVFCFGRQLHIHGYQQRNQSDEEILKYMTGKSLEDHLARLKNNCGNTIEQSL